MLVVDGVQEELVKWHAWLPSSKRENHFFLWEVSFPSRKLFLFEMFQAFHSLWLLCLLCTVVSPTDINAEENSLDVSAIIPVFEDSPIFLRYDSLTH